MFLAFSLLLVGWQACYAVRRVGHPAYHNEYPTYPDTYPTHPHDHPSHPHDRPTRPHDRPTHPHAHPTYQYPRNVQFPDDFSFGTSTSAYQIEGAWNEDGKCENIWDRFLHTHRHYANGTNGDVAANAYHKVKEDVELLNFLNVRHHRLSLSWSRLLPNGFATYVNPKAVEHYRKQFKLLRDNQIEPFVTLYHWDLPQNLQDLGGFQNESIVSWYTDYARIAFELFGEDVKYWSTFNEPYQICALGYGNSVLAPAINKSGVADYICGHNLLKAHAAAWHVYDKEFRTEQCGKVSINLGFQWIEPASDCDEDRLAAQIQREFYLGWFANPLYHGDYPEVMKQRVQERCTSQGIQNRLPEFSQKEIQYIKGTHDYFSLNSDIILRAKAIVAPVHANLLQYDVGAIIYPKKGNHAYGIKNVLVWIKKKYNNPSIFITESGIGLKSAALEDPERITFFKKTLNYVYDAMNIDGVRVYGYTVRSFIDGFEWLNGYRYRYGLYYTDFKDHKRTRTPRKSAWWYKEVCTTRCTGD